MANSPTSRGIDPASDVVFTWNGTTSGVRVPDADWIADDRTGPDHLRRDFGGVRPGHRLGKIDVGTFSWQKALGGEARTG
jgi:phosphoserine aminotransferase